MIPYWSKQINVEQLGKRVVRVQCSQCDCEYYYTLIRVGRGTGTAPYSMGIDRATRSAQKQASEELEQRLKSDAELVPCPSCLWINDELVQAHRLTRYRILNKFAGAFAIVGTCVLVLFACFYQIDPLAARAMLPYFLICETVICVFGLGMIAVRNHLRSRVHPNQFFPEPPKLPAGMPTPHVVDPSTGELVPAVSNLPPFEFANGWLDFRIGNDHLPMLCCDCLDDARSGLGYQAQVSATKYLEILRCSDCARLVQRTYWRRWFRTAAWGLLLVGATAPFLGLQSPDLWFAIGGAFLIVLVLASYVASTAIKPVKVGVQDITRGIVKLRFRNPEYARLVAEHLSSL